jgi:hypothetical protein
MFETEFRGHVNTAEKEKSESAIKDLKEGMLTRLQSGYACLNSQKRSLG